MGVAPPSHHRGAREGAASGRTTTASSLIEMCRDEPMVIRRVVVEPRQVVYVKGIVEASAGLATMVADGGGELVLVAPTERTGELDELLADLREEIGLRVRGTMGAGPSPDRDEGGHG